MGRRRADATGLDMAKFRMRDGTGTVELTYVVEDVDRHGNVRLYVKRRGAKKVRLRQRPGTAEFMAEYRDALAGRSILASVKHEIQVPAGKGTLRWLCEQYYRSAEFKRLDDRTRRVRRQILEGACARDGSKPYVMMEPRHVRARRDEKSERPESANGLLKALRQVFTFAVENDLAERNPAQRGPLSQERTRMASIRWSDRRGRALRERSSRSGPRRGWRWPCCSIPGSGGLMWSAFGRST